MSAAKSKAAIRAARWREKNPGAFKQWYEKNREQQLERARAYAESNADQIKEKRKARHEREREKSNAKNKAWREANGAYNAERISEWRRMNRDKCNAVTHKRRARKLNATPCWFGEPDELVMLEAGDLAQRRTRATSAMWEIDHMVPLQAKKACGLHCAANIQVIPAALNRSKRNSMLFSSNLEWLGAL